MLNRRYLRIKVFQSLYAHWQGEEAGASRLEKELHGGMERARDLYLALLLVFGELCHVAELRIEGRGKKHLPTDSDLNPNKRFVEGKVINAVVGNERLRIEAEKRRISWVGNQELFVRMYKDLEECPEYQAYMSGPVPGVAKERDFLVWVLTDQIANSEALQEVFESRSIYWLEDLDLAASMVKRTLEQFREGTSLELDLAGLSLDQIEEKDFVTTLFRKTIELGEEHEAAISEKASNWDADRIALSDMILMKMALTEVRVFDQIPIKVTLNEYIEIAKSYSTPKSKNFINGVLDKIFIEMKADGKIHKVGRGLLES